MLLQWSHQADWPALPENVSAARRFVCGWLAGHDLDALVGDAQLVVSELATNAVLHARTPFTVMVTRTLDTVTVSVTDGVAVDIRGPATAWWYDVSGRGLYMVGAYSKEWGVTPTQRGKTVWATFSLA
jgi:Histidine kinase-like ATPase domain